MFIVTAGTNMYDLFGRIHIIVKISLKYDVTHFNKIMSRTECHKTTTAKYRTRSCVRRTYRLCHSYPNTHISIDIRMSDLYNNDCNEINNYVLTGHITPVHTDQTCMKIVRLG